MVPGCREISTASYSRPPVLLRSWNSLLPILHLLHTTRIMMACVRTKFTVLTPCKQLLSVRRKYNFMEPATSLVFSENSFSLILNYTTPALVSRASTYRICDGQIGARRDFLRVLLFPLPIFVPPIAAQSPSSVTTIISHKWP
jgi:hypothetical protein